MYIIQWPICLPKQPITSPMQLGFTTANVVDGIGQHLRDSMVIETCVGVIAFGIWFVVKCWATCAHGPVAMICLWFFSSVHVLVMECLTIQLSQHFTCWKLIGPIWPSFHVWRPNWQLLWLYKSCSPQGMDKQIRAVTNNGVCFDLGFFLQCKLGIHNHPKGSWFWD